MKILLVAINAKYIHSNPAVYSLKKSAKGYGEAVEIVEYTINNSLEHILQSIYSKKADVICFSCYIWNIQLVDELSEIINKLCPNIPIWLGGPEVSYDTDNYLKNHSYIKGIIVGEGEETFKELCGYYLNNNSENSLKNIAGLTFLDGKKIIHTPYRDCVDFDSLPFYYDDLKDFENRIIYYESSRGCPFSCSYCLSSIEKSVRLRSLEKVKKELLFFLENNVKQVKFIDRTFNCNKEHALNIWKFILENDNGITNFHFEIGADLLSEEQIALLNEMRPGLVQLEIGVQTTNEETLCEIHRKMDFDTLSKNIKAIKKKNNIHQHLDLIAGLPYEGLKSFRKSFNDIINLRPNQLQLGFLKVLKGSYMWEHSKEYDLLYRQSPPYEVLSTKWINYDEIIKIKGAEETLEVYYNSGQYSLTMELLLRIVNSPFDLFINFGKFYFDMGYNSMSFSRIARCEKLLEFIESDEFSNLELNENLDLSMIKEALIYDLYSKENCKSRPSWAIDKEELKAMNRLYCKNSGSRRHIEPFSFSFDKIVGGQKNMPLKLNQPIWIIFNYEKINPITKRAETYSILQ